MGLTGALRDMYDPTCYVNPGKVSDAQYGCGTADGGGVHNNSGVPNHAYALIVDGGTYNGQTITGIGLTKAAHIYFRASPSTRIRRRISPTTRTRSSSRRRPRGRQPRGSGDRVRRPDRSSRPPTSRRFTRRCWQSKCATRRRSADSSRCWPRTRRRLCDHGLADPAQGRLRGRHLRAGPLTLATRGRRTSPSATGRSCVDLPDGRAGRALFGPIPTSAPASGRQESSGPARRPGDSFPAASGRPAAHVRALGRDGSRVRRRQRQDQCQRGAIDDHSDGEFHLQRPQRDSRRGSGQHRPARRPARLSGHRRRSGRRHLGSVDRRSDRSGQCQATRFSCVSTSARTAAPASSAGTSTTCTSTTASRMPTATACATRTTSAPAATFRPTVVLGTGKKVPYGRSQPAPAGRLHRSWRSSSPARPERATMAPSSAASPRHR